MSEVLKTVLTAAFFVAVATVVFYFVKVRPAIGSERDQEMERLRRPVNGDRLAFSDGMVGTLVKRTKNCYVIATGPDGHQVKRRQEDLALNMTGERRAKEAL